VNVSTTGIGMFSSKDVFGEVSAAQDPPPTDGSVGYATSKWTRERYLEKVNNHCGWPITILRPSSISREDVLDFDLMQNLLHYSRLIQGVPVFPNIRGGLNLVSLESILQNTMQELHQKPTGQMQHVNLIGDVIVPLNGIKLLLDEESGGDAAKLPIDEWITRAESLGLHKILVAFFDRVTNIQVVTFPRLEKNL
jgi:hybrid polyketide synthase/nonribosomal peptide synthetase ACE1